MNRKEELRGLIKTIMAARDMTQREVSKGAGYEYNSLSQALAKSKGYEPVIEQLRLVYKDVLENPTSISLTPVTKIGKDGGRRKGTPSVLEEINANLKLLSTDVRIVYNEQLKTRAEVRAFGEYQVMKDAKNDEKRRKEIMAQINKLIGLNLKVDDQKGSNAAGRI